MSSPIEPLEAPRSVRLVTVLVVVGIFSAGALAGAGAQRWLAPHRGHGGPLAELQLSPSQRMEARAIHDRHRAELDAAMLKAAPELRAIHARMDAELAPMLTPEQQRKLEALRARQIAGEPPPPPRDKQPD